MPSPTTSVLRIAAPLAAVFAAVPVFAQAPAKVTYVDNVLPIFRNTCNNCHNPDKKKAGLDLTTYASTMAGSENGPIVKPGQGDASLLFKVCAQIEDPKMPPKGDKLTEAELGTIKNWIAGFALETATSKPAAVQQNQVALAVVSLERPAGPPPMPGDLPLEPYVRPRAANAIVAMAASPWAPLVALGGQKQVILYNTESLQPVGVLPFPEGFPQILRFSRNGQLLLAGGGFGGKSGRVVLWNIADGKRVGVVGDEVDQVLAADISPDHGHVALGGPGKILKIYNTKDGKLEQKLKKHTDWVTAVAFSPDGKYLASADRNGGVMVWEGATGKEYQALAGHKSAVTALAFMPGVLASAGADGKIILWNVKEGSEAKSWTAHNGGVEWIDFTPDGRLVSCGRDKTAKVWDSQGKVLFTSEAFADIALRAELNTERIVAADWTGRIRAFGLDGKPLAELTANLPPLADQLGGARKKLADAQAALPGLQQALAAAEGSLKQEIANADKAKADAQAAIESAKSGTAAAEKKTADAKAEAEKLKAARQTAEASAEQDAAVKKAAVEQAAKAYEEGKARVAAAEAEWTKAKAELPKTIAAQEKIAAEATKRQADLSAPIQPVAPAPPAPSADHGKLTLLQKKLDELTAGIEARRAERAKFTEGTPEYDRANEKVQALKPQIAEAEAALAAASSQPAPAAPAPAPAPNTVRTAVANARASLDACTATLAAAQAEAQRLERASAYMDVHRAETTLAEMTEKHEDLVATAKDALKQSDMIRDQIASLDKSVAAAPTTLKQAEDALAATVAARDSSAKALADAQALVAEKEKAPVVDPKAIEAEIAAATKKVADLNTEIEKRRAERAKFAAESEDYKKADALVQALKPDIAKAEEAIAASKAKLDTAKPKPAGPAPELVAAREAVKKAELDARHAADKVAPAEKALASLKKSQAEDVKQLADLRQKAPALVQAAKQAKVKAEADAAAFAKDLEKAKSDATRIRADFDTKWRPPQKTASTK